MISIPGHGPPRQRELELGASHRSRRLRGPENQSYLTVRFEDGGVVIELTGKQQPHLYYERDLHLHMHLRVRPPLVFEVPDWDDYDLAFELPDSFEQVSHRDCIRAVYGAAERYFEDNSFDRVEEEAFLAKVFTLLEEAREHLREQAIPEALLATERFVFGTGVSFFVYCKAASDPSGRVAQLCHTCPGLMILIKDFDMTRHKYVAGALIERVIRGDRLPAILRSAAQTWIEKTGRPSDDSGLLSRQRLFVRRAGPGVSPDVLRNGPPRILIPEHIPKSVEANAIWYGFMWNATYHIEVGAQFLSEGQADDLYRFFSRHALGLRARGGVLGQHGLEIAYGANSQQAMLVRFVGATGRRVNHRTDLNRLADELTGAIHGGSRGDLKRRLRLTRKSSTNSPFPATPLSRMLPWRDAGISVDLLADPAAVIAEAITMGHCIHQHLPEAASGEYLLFHVEVDGEALTAIVKKSPNGGYEDMEVAGYCDREPSGRERDLVSRCLDFLFEWAGRG